MPKSGLKSFGQEMERTANYTFKRLNDQCAVPGYRLLYEVHDTQCSVGKGFYELANAIESKRVDAIVGEYRPLSVHCTV